MCNDIKGLKLNEYAVNLETKNNLRLSELASKKEIIGKQKKIRVFDSLIHEMENESKPKRSEFVNEISKLKKEIQMKNTEIEEIEKEFEQG